MWETPTENVSSAPLQLSLQIVVTIARGNNGTAVTLRSDIFYNPVAVLRDHTAETSALLILINDNPLRTGIWPILYNYPFIFDKTNILFIVSL